MLTAETGLNRSTFGALDSEILRGTQPHGHGQPCAIDLIFDDATPRPLRTSDAPSPGQFWPVLVELARQCLPAAFETLNGDPLS